MASRFRLASTNSATQLWARITSGILSRGALSFLIAAAGVNVSNFLFHIIISRLLGPAHYGAVGSILSILSLIAVPIGAAQLAVTQAVMSHVDKSESFSLSTLIWRGFLAGVFSAIAFASLIPVVDSFLHLSSPLPLFMVSIWIPLATTGAVLQGALIGEYRYRAMAFATFAGGGPIRLLFGAGMIEAGFGVTGAIIATIFAQAFTTGSMLFSSRRKIRLQRQSAVVRTSGRDMSLSIFSIGGYTALIGIDSFLARHFFSAFDAGQYAAAAVAAHIALFVPGAIVTVAFPHWVSGQGTSLSSRKAFVQALKITTMLGFLAAGMLTILSSFVVHILFGSKYDHAIAGIGLLSFASAMIGILSLFVYFHLARRSFAALTPWIGVALSAILITLRHSSITTVATTMLVVSVLTLLVIALPALVAFLVASARENGSYKNRFEPNSHGLPPAEIDFTLVVPFYNPGSRFGKHVGEIIEVLTSSHINFEILAVSDGSTDHSEDQLSSFDTDRLSLVCLPDNQGKGAALRAGLEIGRGKYLGFIDGDGDLPANLISDVLEIIDREHPDIVFGSKRHPRSNVVYPPLRRIYSWAYQQMNRALFHLPVRDTQTGVKVIRRDVLSAVLPRMVEKRFAFDLELFVVARQQGFKNFVEMPVTIRDRFTSTISVHSVRNMLIDTLAIFYRLKVLRFYERDIRGKTEASLLMPSIPDENITISVGERTQSTQEPKLRILILNWRDITHPNAGGAEVYTHTVANEWLKKGHSVTLFSAAVEGRPEYEDLGGIHIIRRGSRHGVYREAKQYYRREGRGNFDLVIDEVNTRPFGAPKWVDDVPVTALIHQVCREIWSYQTPFPVSFIGRYILEPLWLRGYRDVAIVTLSDSSKESLKKYGLRRVVVVPVGHQPLERLPDVARETVPTLVFVGRLTPNKRPEDAIRAFGLLREKISDAVLWVIGTGPLEDKLRMSAPDGVQFLGKISPYEKTERLARAHALVATSVREGWGLVVTEAAAVGTPTIAYDVAGLRDSVSASKGVLSEPNPSSLCSILFDFLTTWPANSKDVSALGVIPWSQVAEEILAVATGSPQPQYTCILNTRTISAQNGDHLSTAIEPSDSVVLLQGDGA